jgi:hypothetical protein
MSSFAVMNVEYVSRKASEKCLTEEEEERRRGGGGGGG